MGAGKTALLLATARLLAQRGIQAGLVTHDCIAGQVDSAVLEQTGLSVREVKGSSLRCRFNRLASAIGTLKEELVLAEPMGSCADLSATILEPLRRYLGDRWALAPLSVLAAPERVTDILAGGDADLPAGAAYVFRAQLEAADFILLSKCDAESAGTVARLCEGLRAAYPRAQVFAVSAHRHDGLPEWLDAVLADTADLTRLVPIDYARYAEGARAFAWLNATASLSGARDWNGFAWRVMRLLRAELAMRRLPVAHVKLLLRAGEAVLSANHTGTAAEPSFQGWISQSPTADFTLNARVAAKPRELEGAVRDVLEAACREEVRMDLHNLRSARPARPDGTYRFDAPHG